MWFCIQTRLPETCPTCSYHGSSAGSYSLQNRLPHTTQRTHMAMDGWLAIVILEIKESAAEGERFMVQWVHCTRKQWIEGQNSDFEFLHGTETPFYELFEGIWAEVMALPVEQRRISALTDSYVKNGAETLLVLRLEGGKMLPL